MRAHVGVAPNGMRLSCGALKKDSFRNLRAPSDSNACQAATGDFALTHVE